MWFLPRVAEFPVGIAVNFVLDFFILVDVVVVAAIRTFHDGQN